MSVKEVSGGNFHVRKLRRLARDSELRKFEKRYVVEGPRLVLEAFEAGLEIDQVFFPSDDIDEKLVEVLKSKQISCLALNRQSFNGLTTLKNPQAAIASVIQHDVELGDLTISDGVLLVLVDVADPGNSGALVRSAEAFGASGVVFFGGVDPYNPKVVRSAAGSIFRIPIVLFDEVESADLLVQELQEASYCVIATTPSGGISPEMAPKEGRRAVLLGNEPKGLSEEVQSACDVKVTVPIEESIESLNVSVAGAVVLYGLTRPNI